MYSQIKVKSNIKDYGDLETSGKNTIKLKFSDIPNTGNQSKELRNDVYNELSLQYKLSVKGFMPKIVLCVSEGPINPTVHSFSNFIKSVEKKNKIPKKIETTATDVLNNKYVYIFLVICLSDFLPKILHFGENFLHFFFFFVS